MEIGSRRTRNLDVAIVTMHIDEDPAVNRQRIITAVRETARVHPRTRLIVFGELALGWFWHGERDGVPFDDTVKESTEYHERIAEPAPGPTANALGQVAREHDVYISYGFTERDGERIYNSQALIAPDGSLLDVRRKQHLASPMFTSGAEPPRVVDVDGSRVVTIICSDDNNPTIRKAVRRLNPDIVLQPLCDPWASWTAAAPDRLHASYYCSALLLPNRVGGEPQPASRYRGFANIYTSYGKLLVRSVGRECVLRTSIPIRSHRQPSWQAVHRLFCTLAFVLWAPVGQYAKLYTKLLRALRSLRRNLSRS